MKNIFYILAITLLSCNFEKKPTEAEILNKESLTDGMIGGSIDTSFKNVKIVENNYDITKDTISLPSQVKKALKKSTLKAKSCADILQEYGETILAIKANPKSKNVAKLALYANDPFYNNCYNTDKSFRDKVDKLDLILENI